MDSVVHGVTKRDITEWLSLSLLKLNEIFKNKSEPIRIFYVYDYNFKVTLQSNKEIYNYFPNNKF